MEMHPHDVSNDDIGEPDLGNPADWIRFIAYAADLAGAILEHGFAIQMVFPADESDGPWFAYTVGLADRYGAEVLVRGFGDRTGELVDYIVSRLVSGDLKLEPGDYEPGIRIEEWRGDPTDFGAAEFWNRSQGIEYVKLHALIADDHGRFPGDPGCDIAEFQLLGLPERGASGG